MSRDLYTSLFDPEAEETHPLVTALAQAGQARRDAFELADAEYREGLWVDEAAMPDEAQMRLAAQDETAHGLTTSYVAGPYTVRVERDPAGDLVAIQTTGPAGCTLEIGDAWIPLDLDVQALLPGVSTPPATLVLLDRAGHRHTLRQSD